jgi:hypothetical protein
MPGLIAPEQRTVTSWRSAWRCRPGGFAAVAPLSGSRVVAAVGRVAVTSSASTDAVRGAMRALMEDLALVVGHDPAALLERSNAAMSSAGLGQLDAVALLSRPDDHIPASVAGRGDPAPLVVAPDRLTVPVRGSVGVDRRWTVVLGAADAPGVPHTLLSPGEVRHALSLLDPPSPASATASRTLLALVAT